MRPRIDSAAAAKKTRLVAHPPRHEGRCAVGLDSVSEPGHCHCRDALGDFDVKCGSRPATKAVARPTSTHAPSVGTTSLRRCEDLRLRRTISAKVDVTAM